LEYETEEEQIGVQTPGTIITEPPAEPRKFYIDGGEVEVIGHLVYDLDTDGKKLQVVKYTEYSGRAVRTLYPTREALQSAWANPDTRAEVLRELTERGISFAELASQQRAADADPFDLLCHLAWNAPLLTRRQRAEARPSGRRKTCSPSTATPPAKSSRCCSTNTSSAASCNSMPV
jgi:type I restriction enzyme R subunit